MTRWSSPVACRLLPTLLPDSYGDMPPGWTGLPAGPRHPGAFGFPRRHHVHEGVDIYVPAGTPVAAVEPGRVALVAPFTGPGASPPSPWWLDTMAVMVEGASGVVLYGEVEPAAGLRAGAEVARGQQLGRVARVLARDKGRPVSMLHLELHAPGSRAFEEWRPGTPCPARLRDPTAPLLGAASRGWDVPGRPSFLKAGDSLVPISSISEMRLGDIGRGEVTLVTGGGKEFVARGFDAVEAVMLTRPSALEGRRLRWRKGAWAMHNVLAHPAMQVLAWLGKGRLGVRLHDATTPWPRA